MTGTDPSSAGVKQLVELLCMARSPVLVLTETIMEMQEEDPSMLEALKKRIPHCELIIVTDDMLGSPYGVAALDRDDPEMMKEYQNFLEHASNTEIIDLLEACKRILPLQR